MKKEALEAEEKRPFELTQRFEELKGVKRVVERAEKEAYVREERLVEARLKNSAHESEKSALKAKGQSMPLRLKMTHCLGDVVSRFHPSKSRKGSRRSEV